MEDRPGLGAALVALESGEAEGLIVHRLDRLARELHVQKVALAHAWNVGDHVCVFEVVEGEVPRDDPNDPHRRFLRQVVGAAAELERGLIKRVFTVVVVGRLRAVATSAGRACIVATATDSKMASTCRWRLSRPSSAAFGPCARA